MATEIFRSTKDRSKKSSFEFYAQKKLNRRKITNAENYAKSAKTKKISSRKLNKDAIWKRKQRQRIKEKECKENVKKEKQKMYTRRAREKKRLDKTMNEETCLKDFKHRMEKSRAMKTLKLSLPETPNRRVSLLQSYLKMNSPTIKTLEKMKIVRSPDDEVVNNVAENAMKDMRAVLDSTKQQRSSESNLARKLLFAAVCGEVVGGNKCKVKLAKQLGVKRGKIAAAGRTRTRILKSSTSCWKLAEKNNRKNHISHESKKLAYDFWLRSGMSRPTGNKKDIKRERLEPHVFISHMIHVLEKSQTEVYNDFRLAYPDIHMSQRSFERLKPFFVRAVRTNDRNTCLCRYHVEFKTVFEHCMRARRNILVSHADPSKKDTYTIFQSINEIISCTLCAKEDFSDHYDISCLNRTCSTCGVKGFQQMAEEKSEEIVEWERFEYVSIATKGNQTRKKCMLVKKKSSIAKLFTYFIELLSVFPAHQFRSVWQNQQLKALTTTLPQNDCVVVHDFSENYRVAAKEELQSAYFQRTEVTIHISILYRHAMLELDGIDSTEAKPEIVAEQFITISDDDKHDHHFVHSVQQLIQEYLLSLNYKVNTMHEFTDGCQAQYKSRNCMGDISYACSDFRYQRVIRNFFETSHAKGPQDAAGGYIKRQFDLAILRGKARLQNAEECYNYARENLSSTQKSSTTSHRIFRYIKDVDRSRNRSFKPVKGNRSIHQIMSTDDGVLTVSDMSCYSCNNCSAGLYDECLDKTRRCPRESQKTRKKMR